MSAGSSAGSVNRSSTSAAQRCSKATLASMSSRTRKPGGSPTSKGCSLRIRDAKPCRVVSTASSSWSSAVRQRRRAAGSGYRSSSSPDTDALEAGPHPVAELSRGGLRERDGREVAQLDTVGGDERDHTVDERGGLPGPGARLDEEADVVPVADPLPAPPGHG